VNGNSVKARAFLNVEETGSEKQCSSQVQRIGKEKKKEPLGQKGRMRHRIERRKKNKEGAKRHTKTNAERGGTRGICVLNDGTQRVILMRAENRGGKSRKAAIRGRQKKGGRRLNANFPSPKYFPPGR